MKCWRSEYGKVNISHAVNFMLNALIISTWVVHSLYVYAFYTPVCVHAYVIIIIRIYYIPSCGIAMVYSRSNENIWLCCRFIITACRSNSNYRFDYYYQLFVCITSSQEYTAASWTISWFVVLRLFLFHMASA